MKAYDLCIHFLINVNSFTDNPSFSDLYGSYYTKSLFYNILEYVVRASTSLNIPLCLFCNINIGSLPRLSIDVCLSKQPSTAIIPAGTNLL